MTGTGISPRKLRKRAAHSVGVKRGRVATDRALASDSRTAGGFAMSSGSPAPGKRPRKSKSKRSPVALAPSPETGMRSARSRDS